MSAAGPQLINDAWMVREQVRKTLDYELFTAKLPLLATLPDRDLDELHKKVGKKFRLDKTKFDELIAREREEKIDSGDGRPTIRVSNRLLDEVSAEAVAAMVAVNEPPSVFRRGGDLVHIDTDECGRAAIVRYDQYSLRSKLARSAGFVTFAKSGRATKCSPPLEIAIDILKAGIGVFPPLVGVASVPAITDQGAVQRARGYNPSNRTYYNPEPGFRLGAIAERPTQADAQVAARFLIDEMLGEFPYESQADRANAVAAFVSTTLRAGCSMKFPLLALDAPKGGHGKTLLGTLLSVFGTGHDAQMSSLPETEAEMRKTITTLLDSGTPIIIFDNVSRPIRSGVLASALTAEAWSDRGLGKMEKITAPNRSIWVVTGNNLQFGAEMTRRAYRVRLDAKLARPEKRTGFKRPDDELVRWLKQNRGDVVAAVLTMISAWIVAGKPKADVPAFGSFNEWAQTVGGVLTYAGVTDFLGNLDQVQLEADEESDEWEEFLTRWAMVHGGAEFSVADMLAGSGWDFVRAYLPDGLDQFSSDTSLRKKLGQALKRKAGTRFGERELRVERARMDSHSKSARWRVCGNLAGLEPT